MCRSSQTIALLFVMDVMGIWDGPSNTLQVYGVGDARDGGWSSARRDTVPRAARTTSRSGSLKAVVGLCGFI